VYIVAESGESAETNKFDSRFGDMWIRVPTDMSSMGSCSVGAGDRDRSRKLDGLEKILESIGYGEGSFGGIRS